ncbi:MAG: hypothetical protein M3Q71_14970 [Chloroflexota bacterium]|nr:hypothetical protein [Chloroflexota bacterium]
MKRFWQDYSLGIVYVAAWLLTWGLHAGFTYWADQYPHDTVPWILQWLETSFENLASEYHQVGAFILLAKFYRFKGSPQSKDEGA